MSNDGLNNNGGPEVGKMDGFHDPMKHDLKDDDLLDYHAVDYCIKQMNAETEKPFFVACGLYKPHLPFAVPRKYYDLFPLESIELPPYQADDLDDLPPSGVKMAGPNCRSCEVPKIGSMESGHPVLSCLVRLHRHERGATAGCNRCQSQKR